MTAYFCEPSYWEARFDAPSMVNQAPGRPTENFKSVLKENQEVAWCVAASQDTAGSSLLARVILQAASLISEQHIFLRKR